MKAIVAKFPHAPNSQPQAHPPEYLEPLYNSGAQVRAQSVAQIHILFNSHRTFQITWPADNLYPCVGVLGSGVVAAAAMVFRKVARYFVVVVGCWRPSRSSRSRQPSDPTPRWVPLAGTRLTR